MVPIARLGLAAWYLIQQTIVLIVLPGEGKRSASVLEMIDLG